jgi:hypothetical protein
VENSDGALITLSGEFLFPKSYLIIRDEDVIIKNYFLTCYRLKH